MVHLVKEIVAVEPFKLTLKFNTGEVRMLDLEDKLNEWAVNPQSKFAELKDFENFQKVSLDENFDTLVWENGIDLCPDVLYNLSTRLDKKDVA